MHGMLYPVDDFLHVLQRNNSHPYQCCDASQVPDRDANQADEDHLPSGPNAEDDRETHILLNAGGATSVCFIARGTRAHIAAALIYTRMLAARITAAHPHTRLPHFPSDPPRGQET